MKKLLVVSLVSAFLVGIAACGGDSKTEETSKSTDAVETTETTSDGNPSYDPKRGEGQFKDVQITATLDGAMAEAGGKVADVKCISCHKLTDEKLVGPGWKGVTSRHSADWIMNFLTNTDAMIDKDPYVQAQLEICMVRMPNQSVSEADARSVYEFMRKNDGVK